MLSACGEKGILNTFFSSSGMEIDLSSSCFISWFSQCLLELLAVRRKKSAEVSSFTKMIKHLTCSTVLYVDDICLCLSVLANCRGDRSLFL